jgi:hypothetical protein
VPEAEDAYQQRKVTPAVATTHVSSSKAERCSLLPSLTGSPRAPIDAKARPPSENVGLVVSANIDGDRVAPEMR